MSVVPSFFFWCIVDSVGRLKVWQFETEFDLSWNLDTFILELIGTLSLQQKILAVPKAYVLRSKVPLFPYFFGMVISPVLYRDTKEPILRISEILGGRSWHRPNGTWHEEQGGELTDEELRSAMARLGAPECYDETWKHGVFFAPQRVATLGDQPSFLIHQETSGRFVDETDSEQIEECPRFSTWSGDFQKLFCGLRN